MVLSHSIAIGVGGALGALARAWMSYVLPTTLLTGFPIAILIINVLGCFGMGVLSELIAGSSPFVRSLLVTGFLGSFTTFSAFALEFSLLFDKNLYGWGLFYTVVSVSGSIGGFFLGAKALKFFAGLFS